MSFKLRPENVNFDLIYDLHNISTHPYFSKFYESTQRFATSSSSSNWKPFIIGFIPPDNPVDFVPTRRIHKEIRKAPPLKKSAGSAGGSAPSSGDDGIVLVKYQKVKIEELRKELIKQWTNRTGSEPDDTLVRFMIAQILIESSGTYIKNGELVIPDVIHPPNFNMFGYHDVGSMPATFAAKWNADHNRWEDGRNNWWDTKGHKISDPLTSDNTIGIIRFGKLYFAPPTLGAVNAIDQNEHPLVGGNANETAAFYAAIKKPGQRYLGTDTEGSRPYISSYRSFPSLESAIHTYVGYLHGTFPKVINARTGEEFNRAIQDKKYSGGTNNFHCVSEEVDKRYRESLESISQAIKRDDERAGLAMGGSSVDSTFDPDQRIMAYGSSFDKYDPLAPILGRNIEVDVGRFLYLESKMDGIKTQLDAMRKVPYLIMLINPSEFERSHEDLVDFGVKTRTGNILHTWLEQPIKINCSGVTPLQYAVYSDMAGGLTNYNRIHSLSYRNLMSLVMLYKSNGNLYDFPSGTGQFGSVAGDGSIILPGSMFIYFDEHIYIGSFDNLSVSDDASKPYNMSYSFSFTVSYDITADNAES